MEQVRGWPAFRSVCLLFAHFMTVYRYNVTFVLFLGYISVSIAAQALCRVGCVSLDSGPSCQNRKLGRTRGHHLHFHSNALSFATHI